MRVFGWVMIALSVLLICNTLFSQWGISVVVSKSPSGAWGTEIERNFREGAFLIIVHGDKSAPYYITHPTYHFPDKLGWYHYPGNIDVPPRDIMGFRFWLVSILLCVAGAFLLRRSTRKHKSPETCNKCGYDLRAHVGSDRHNQGSRCPECGTPIPQNPPPQTKPKIPV